MSEQKLRRRWSFLRDSFEIDVGDLMGKRLRNCKEDCEALWGALVNTRWSNIDGRSLLLSYREAGHLISNVIGTGDYNDWYCSAPSGVVAPWIVLAMSQRGWSPLSVTIKHEGPVVEEARIDTSPFRVTPQQVRQAYDRAHAVILPLGDQESESVVDGLRRIPELSADPEEVECITGVVFGYLLGRADALAEQRGSPR